jgi:hypothetical protein
MNSMVAAAQVIALGLLAPSVYWAATLLPPIKNLQAALERNSAEQEKTQNALAQNTESNQRVVTAYEAMLQLIAHQKGVPVSQLDEVLARISDAGLPKDQASVRKILLQKADQIKALEEQLRQLSGTDPKTHGGAGIGGGGSLK